VRSFEEVKNPRTKHGHGSPGSWKAVIVGCLKETEKFSSRRILSEAEQVTKKKKEETGEKRCLRDGTMTRL